MPPCCPFTATKGRASGEWQEQADALREGSGGDETKNEDANVSQMIADALRELDEESASPSGDYVYQANAEVSAAPSSENSAQLARLWVALGDVQSRIDNEVIPLGMRLDIEDPELMQALEILSGCVGNHFERWRLVAVPMTAARRKR